MKYVTYKTTYEGLLLPKYYIGSTSENRAKSGNYFGSIRSRSWKEIFYKELKENKHLFSIQILSYHDNRVDALKEELRLQKELDVVKSSQYFNESYAAPNGFFGLSSDAQRLIVSNRMKMMNSGKIPGRAVGNNKSGKHQDNNGNKNPMYGKKHKKDSIMKNSQSVKKNRSFKIKCEFCGKLVDSANLKRWHNEKCKSKI